MIPRTADGWLAMPRLNPWHPFLSDIMAAETIRRLSEIRRGIFAAVFARR